MKKVLVLGMSLLTLSTCFAQDSLKPKKEPLNCYASGFFATSTGNNFNAASYAGVEVGVGFKNVQFGISSGRGNLDKTIGAENVSNYWYEAKTYATFPLGNVKGFVVAGWGQYYNSTHNFIEYGGGIVYSIKNVDLMLQVSNWDGVVYVSPGIAYNFQIKK